MAQTRLVSRTRYARSSRATRSPRYEDINHKPLARTGNLAGDDSGHDTAPCLSAVSAARDKEKVQVVQFHAAGQYDDRANVHREAWAEIDLC